MNPLNDSLTTTEIVITSASDRVEAKGLSLNAYARQWAAGIETGGRHPDRPTKSYNQSSWVYICVNKIINAARAIPLVISDGDDNIIESGPLYDLLYKQTGYSLSRLMTDLVGFLALFRAVYLFRGKDDDGRLSLRAIGPHQIEPDIRSGVLVRWIYKHDGTEDYLMLHEIYPILDFNPYGDKQLAGPDSVARLAISSAYQASLYSESVLANGGRVGNVMSVPGKADPDDIARYESSFRAKHGGASNAGKLLIVTGGATVDSVAQSMTDMDGLEGRRFDAKEICAVMGVPPELAGLATEAQYAHGPAQQQLILNTVAPLLSFLAGHLTTAVTPLVGTRQGLGVSLKSSTSFCGNYHLPLAKRQSYRQAKSAAIAAAMPFFIWFNIDDHPTVQAMRQDQAEKCLTWAKTGVPINQIIAAYDLPFDTTEMPWGDEYFISSGLMPARWIMDAGADALLGAPLAEGDGGGDLGTDDNTDNAEPEKAVKQKAVDLDQLRQKELTIWKRWVASWQPLEKEYTSALRVLFAQQQKELIGKLKAAWPNDDGKGLETKADVGTIVGRVVFDLKKSNNKLKVIHKTYWERGLELGVRQAAAESAIEDAAADPVVKAVRNGQTVRSKFRISGQKISGVNKVTQTRITKLLRDGIKNGDNLQKLTSAIADALGGNRKRALVVARTHTAGAVNTGRHEGFKEVGIRGKKWNTAGDANVRDAHTTAGSTYRKAIPVDDPFIVGGERLMHPGDPAGSPANIINCRCMEIAALLRDGKAIDYDTMTFITERN